MRRKKWLWLGIAAACALPIAAAVLTKPYDEFSEMEALHPWKIREYGEQGIAYDFKVPAELVMAQLPIPKTLKPADFEPRMGSFPIFRFPSGNTLTFTVWSGPWRGAAGGTCTVSIQRDSTYPWYTRSWLILKHRLGLD
jgi:hypothetical protein